MAKSGGGDLHEHFARARFLDFQFLQRERMSVRVKLQGASEQRVVPWSAVMHDINGGTWVYEKTAEHTYIRRRVQVRYVVDDLAVLESGPAAGAP